METDKVTCKVIKETQGAFLLENEHGKQEYFPKSQTSFETRNLKTGDAVAELPVWLLEKKDF